MACYQGKLLPTVDIARYKGHLYAMLIQSLTYAIVFYVKLYEAGVMPKGTDAATYRRMFAQGKVAMLIDNSDNLGIFKAQNPARYPMIKTAPTPFANHASAYEAMFLSVSAGSKHQKEAARFIAFMIRPDNLTVFLLATHAAQGPYKGNILGSSFLKQNPWAKAYLTHVGYAVEPPGLEQYTSKFSTIVLDQVEGSLVGGVPVAQALHSAQQALVAALPHR
jgi:multiple sugar transport system substrate-binding protein